MSQRSFLLVAGDRERRLGLAGPITTAIGHFGLAAEAETETYALYVSPDLSRARLGRASYVIGTLFPRDGAASLTRLGQPACASGGRLLIEQMWGDYVALLVDEGPSQLRALRSPSGGLNAYRLATAGMIFLASDADLLVQAANAVPTIDWTFVADHLRFPHLVARRTGIEGISEIIPGEIISLMPGDVGCRSLWAPWTFTEPRRQFEDPSEARQILREIVLGAVATLAQSRDAILLELSGGLDSSILAASLALANAPAQALNLVTPTAEGDERRFARATAARTGLKLDEDELPAEVDLLASFPFRLARPGVPAMLREADRCLGAHGRRLGVDAFFSGSGGDAVFCSLGSAAAAADVLLSFGYGSRFARAVGALSRIHGASLWQVARMAIRQARRGALHRGWTPAETFLVVDAVPAGPPDHPWLDEPDGVMPGSRSHVRSIMSTLAHLNGYVRQAEAPSVFPLLSQPVIETCLRIPAWFWIAQGQDRAVARQAFRSDLPAAVVNRIGKGRIDAYCVSNVARSVARIRPFLLEGLLLRSGLIDRQALEGTLQASRPPDPTLVYRLLPLIDVETWLRSWESAPARAAA